MGVRGGAGQKGRTCLVILITDWRVAQGELIQVCIRRGAQRRMWGKLLTVIFQDGPRGDRRLFNTAKSSSRARTSGSSRSSWICSGVRPVWAGIEGSLGCPLPIR